MGQPLRIGVNALYLIPGKVGGTEIYLWSLLQALAEIDRENEYFVYLNRETAGVRMVDSPQFRFIDCGVRASFRPWRILWEQTALAWRLRRDGIGVLLNPGFTMPVLFGGASATVFHDLQHKRHPEFFRWFDLPFWNLMLWLAVVRSRSLIAVSEATATDLARFYGNRAARKTVVIPHGVDEEFFRIGERRREDRRCGGRAVEGKYLLTVSTLHPHKNLGRLLEAFGMFRERRPEFRLTIAGLKGFAAERLEVRRSELGLDGVVTFTGWIPRPELYGLFEGATGYVAPSEFEGFGMPVSEALAAGIPCACSAIAPFDEVAGGAAARFDPGSVKAMAAAMEQVACDEGFRARATVAGPEQARRFSWGSSARLTLKALCGSRIP
jgi:glycosyltransferase involved in cell wall biosynthesis